MTHDKQFVSNGYKIYLIGSEFQQLRDCLISRISILQNNSIEKLDAGYPVDLREEFRHGDADLHSSGTGFPLLDNQGCVIVCVGV